MIGPDAIVYSDQLFGPSVVTVADGVGDRLTKRRQGPIRRITADLNFSQKIQQGSFGDLDTLETALEAQGRPQTQPKLIRSPD